MDIHRCRFVPYPASTINALAFSHSHIGKDQKTASPRLAIGRANGDIEIWNPLHGSWLQETIIRGGKDRSIDELVWIQDPNEEDANGRVIIGKSRLFSIGYTTTVTEWDLETGKPLRQASGNHGEIWCLAAQPALHSAKKEAGKSVVPHEGQSLITGCTDGALVLYSTKYQDLQFQKVVVRPSAKKAKIISVVFQDRNIVVAGCTDSMIRVYHIRNGSNLRNMSLGSTPGGGPKHIIVWSVKVLQDGSIISGDSTGELRIWDGQSYMLKQRIQGHRQDVLSLATSFDGSTIFSGGMDRRTVAYKQTGKGKQRWAEIGHRRYHQHDVKAMASLEYKGMSVVISGGPDASPTVLPLRKFGMEHQRTLPFLSQEPVVQSAPKKRLLMSFWEREVHIWRLSKPSKLVPDPEESETESATQTRKLMAKILIKGEANITSAALSADGDLLAVSTVTDIKVFQLRIRQPKDGDGLKVSKVVVPGNISSGAKLVQFSPDRKWLCIVRPDNRISLARLLTSTQSASIHSQITKIERINRKIEKRITLGGLGAYDRTVTQVAFSSESRILAVSDLAGYIDTFVLFGQEDLTLTPPTTQQSAASSSSSSSESESEGEDSENEKDRKNILFGQYWTRNPSAQSTPKLPATPTLLSFRPATALISNGVTHAIPTRHTPNPISHSLPTDEDRLLVITATSEIYEFEVLKGSLSPWSRRNPTSTFPEEFRVVKDLARGCFWDLNAGKERVWVYGIGWLWMFDLSQDFPIPPPQTNGELENGTTGLVNGEGSRKRKRGRKGESSGAGDAISNSELGRGIGRRIQRVIHEEVDEEQEILFHDREGDMDVDSDSDSDLRIQRAGEQVNGEANGIGEDHQDQEEEHGGSWRTFKYRPILGICVVGEGNPDVGLEVAIVERPLWDMDLGLRYAGDQEWEKSGL